MLRAYFEALKRLWYFQSFPNTFYRNLGGWNVLNGGVSTPETEFEAVTKDENGREQVIESNHISTHLHIWGKDDISAAASKYGLSVLEVIKGRDLLCTRSWYLILLRQADCRCLVRQAPTIPS